MTRDLALEDSVVELLLRAGCGTDQARTVAEALDGWRTRPADYVLLDGRLPTAELLTLLGALDAGGGRVALLSDGGTAQVVCEHPAVARELGPPWTLDRLVWLIDWMSGRGAYEPDRTPAATITIV